MSWWNFDQKLDPTTRCWEHWQDETRPTERPMHAHMTFWAVYKHRFIFSTTTPVPLRLVVRTRTDGWESVQTLASGQSSKGLCFLGSKNLWNLHQILIGFGHWLHVNEIFATQKDSEGNCIDILLLACLHKLYIWHGGGGAEQNQNTIKQHRQSLPLSNVSTC